MKKTAALLCVIVICVSFCACTPLSPRGTIVYNLDATEMYYNGNTYLNYRNYNGKYRFDPKKDTDNWVKIATMPYVYILNAVTVYYGNNAENPDFITNTRTHDFYVREGLAFDHNTSLSLCDTEIPYRFQISEIITENVIEYEVGIEKQFEEICNFYAAFEQFPSIRLWITVFRRGDSLYLQDVWNSDYYEITDVFAQDIYRLGLDAFDYRWKTPTASEAAPET